MKKELIILPDADEFSRKFNRCNRRFRRYYACNLDSIQDFNEHKPQLASETSERIAQNYLFNVMVKSIEHLSEIEKKIIVFDFSGEMSLSVDMYLIEKGLNPILKQEINRIKVPDIVDIVFLYSERYGQLLTQIRKGGNEDIESAVINPVYDFVKM